MKTRRNAILSVLFALGAGSAAADEAFLFTAQDSMHGREPWLYIDGEARFLGDLNPGANMYSVQIPTVFSACGNDVYFWADDARHGLELWSSDGGAPMFPGEGIRGFEALRPGPGVEFRDQLVFLNRQGDHSSEPFTQIWSMRAGELRCLAERSQLHGPFFDGDRLLFLDFRYVGKAGIFKYAREWVLLSFDGTRLHDIASGLTGETPTEHASAVLNGSFYTMLSGTQPDTTALYRIDAGGAHLAADEVSAELLVAAESSLYGLSSTARKLWRHDGTALTDIVLGRDTFDEENFIGFRDVRIQAVAQGDDLLFSSRNRLRRVTGDRVVTDSSLSGLVGVGRLKAIDGNLYWHALYRPPDQNSSRGIFRIDHDGPSLLATHSSSDRNHERSYDYYVKNNTVFFGTEDQELSVTDSTGQFNYPLISSHHFAEPPLDSRPQEVAEFDGWLYFQAATGHHGAELWRSDGTTAELIADLQPGSGNSSPEDLRVFQGNLCFTATAHDNGWWRSAFVFDGVSPTPLSGFPVHLELLRVAGDYLIAEDNGSDLWVWDGVNLPVENRFDSFSLSATGYEFLFFKGAYYFTASDGYDQHGQELWRFKDGAFEMVMDVAPGSANSNPRYVSIAGDVLYWTADHPEYGRELWSYDGTTVSMVADINAGRSSSSPYNLTPHGDNLVFAADSPEHGRELWITGPAGTHLMSDLEPGPDSSSPAEISSVAGNLVFAAYSSVHGKELWISRDGHSVELLEDLNPGPASSLPTLQLIEGSQCYYTATPASDDRRLFQVNALGASRVDCVGPKPSGRSPDHLATHGGTHWFAAAGIQGRELYRLDTTGAAKGRRSRLEFFTDLDSGAGSGNPRFLAGLGHLSMFRAKNAVIGEEPVFVRPSPQASGSASSVVNWFDIAEGQELVYPRNTTIPSEVVVVPGAIYFSSTDHRLFCYDGMQTTEVPLPPASTDPRTIEELTVIDGVAYVTLGTSTIPESRNLLKIQGTDVVPLDNGESFYPTGAIVPINGRGLLAGFDSSVSYPYTAPWVIREGGVYPLEGDVSARRPELFTHHDGWLYFLGNDDVSSGSRGFLFRTDGITLERVDLGDQPNLENGGGFLISSGPNLYTATSDINYGTPKILVLTPSGVRIPNGVIPRGLSFFGEFTPIAGNLYLKADYLPAGIFQITPSQITQLGGTNPHDLTEGGGYLYYGASHGGYSELFSHHVATNRNALVPNTYFAPFSTTPGDLYWANDRLYLTASRDAGYSIPLRGAYEFTPPASFRELHNDDISWFREGGGGIVLAGDFPDHTMFVYRANGQELDTQLNLTHYRPDWHPFEGGLVTSAGRSDTGTELYFFDGNQINLLDDLVAGPDSSSPSDFLAVSLEAQSLQPVHPFVGWLASQSVSVQDPSPELLSALEDSQGYPLLLKYATGRSLDEAPASLSVSETEAGQMTVSLSMGEAQTPGVTLTLESSGRLEDGSWQPIVSRLGSGAWLQYGGLVGIGNETGVLTISVTVPQALHRELFFRLRAGLTR